MLLKIFTYILRNKKVLLREHKRHTARKRAQDAEPPPTPAGLTPPPPGPDPPPAAGPYPPPQQLDLPPPSRTAGPDPPPGWTDLTPPPPREQTNKVKL